MFLAAPSHYTGTIKQKDVREQWYNEWDCVHYEILKLVGLLEKGNPNVLSLLWLEPHHVLHTSAAWDELLAIRDAFSSKQVYHSFVGYANTQLHRMTHLVRLLRMGIEFLTEGILHIERRRQPDCLRCARKRTSTVLSQLCRTRNASMPSASAF